VIVLFVIADAIVGVAVLLEQLWLDVQVLRWLFGLFSDEPRMP